MRLPDIPMGGKLVLFGGDFRQLLPVVRNACPGEVIDKCVQSSFLWSNVKILRLTENMRAAVQTTRDPIDKGEFADWLVRVGDGKEPFVRMPGTCVSAPTDLIEIPKSILVYSTEQLLKFVYKDPFGDWHVGRRKSILCPTNRSVDKVNTTILSKLPGEEKTYYSIDEYDQRADDKLHITEDFLNAINLPSIPPHELKLKIGAIVMLVRNLDVPAGLCNGVRLRVCSLGEYTVGVEKLYDPEEECNRDLNNFTLPRVLSKATEGTNLPGALKRLQFPIRLAFAMTINKSQGQTFDRVGVLLEDPCFSHGQLYVAMSRVGSFKNIKVFIADSKKQGSFKYRNGRKFTRNVVYPQVVASKTGEHFLLHNQEQPYTLQEHVMEAVSKKSIKRTASLNSEEIEYVLMNSREFFEFSDASADDAKDNAVETNKAARNIFTTQELDEDVNYQEQPFPLLPIRIPTWNTQELRERISTVERAGTSGSTFHNDGKPNKRKHINIIANVQIRPPNLSIRHKHVPQKTKDFEASHNRKQNAISTQDLDEDVNYDDQKLPVLPTRLPSYTDLELRHRISIGDHPGTSGSRFYTDRQPTKHKLFNSIVSESYMVKRFK